MHKELTETPKSAVIIAFAVGVALTMAVGAVMGKLVANIGSAYLFGVVSCIYFWASGWACGQHRYGFAALVSVFIASFWVTVIYLQ